MTKNEAIEFLRSELGFGSPSDNFTVHIEYERYLQNSMLDAFRPEEWIKYGPVPTPLQCQVYLSKVLKVNHILSSGLNAGGLKTIITFTDINLSAEILSTLPLGKGNSITLLLSDKSRWQELTDYLK